MQKKKIKTWLVISLQFKYACISESSAIEIFVSCPHERPVFLTLHKYKTKKTFISIFRDGGKRSNVLGYLPADTLHITLIQVPAHHQCASEIIK